MSTYSFNTHVAKHTFCKKCGVVPFYNPRSNPDGVAVTLWCLEDRGAVTDAEIRTFDGENWEEQIATSEIKQFSKV